MGPTQLRYCLCGATREVSCSLRIASCVHCGRALALAPYTFEPAPRSGLAQAATFTSQLLGALTFAFALVWMADPSLQRALLALGALWVFAGGSAQRGS